MINEQKNDSGSVRRGENKPVVGGSYLVAKFEKETERLVGFLSKGKRRWLPALSTKQRFKADKNLAEKELKLIESKYWWQASHNYYYKLMFTPQ